MKSSAKKNTRRDLIGAAALSAALSVLGVGSAAADTYPTKPVRVIVPYSPGGAMDSFGRMFSEAMSQELNVPFIIENKPGAGGNIGFSLLKESEPDGYTIAVVPDAIAVNPYLYKELPYSLEKDFASIGMGTATPLALFAHPSTGLRNLDDLLKYAKANPGKLGYGSPGVGTLHHFAMVALTKQAGIELQHIPYKGSAGSIADAAGGHLPLVVAAVSPALRNYVETDRLVALAALGPEPSADFPEVAPVNRLLPGYSFMPLGGFMAPSNTPPEIINKLAKAIENATQSPAVQKQLASAGLLPLYLGPKDMDAYLKDLGKQAGEIAAAANIQPE